MLEIAIGRPATWLLSQSLGFVTSFAGGLYFTRTISLHFTMGATMQYLQVRNAQQIQLYLTITGYKKCKTRFELLVRKS